MGTAPAQTWRDAESEALGGVAEKFFAKELVPHRERFEQQQSVDRSVWTMAGNLGLMCCSVPEEYGGGGGTFAHELAVIEAQSRIPDMSWGNMVHTIVSHYILAYGTEEQKRRWLPPMATGEMVTAIAMTEPGTGSDLQGIGTTAVLDGTNYVINGSKTFISNGSKADLVIVVAKTSPHAGSHGISLIGVETKNCPGFIRGRILKKVGQHAADTSELSFENVRVPAENLLGGVPGEGFVQLMRQLPRERLLVGLSAVASMETALEETIAYTKSREAFGKPLIEFQNTQFVLAEAATKVRVARVFVDSCIQEFLRGELDSTQAAMCKWWLSEMQCDVIDKCLQLFGGYGYMTEYPIARMYADARVQKIYGGSNEIMKLIIARSL